MLKNRDDIIAKGRSNPGSRRDAAAAESLKWSVTIKCSKVPIKCNLAGRMAEAIKYYGVNKIQGASSLLLTVLKTLQKERQEL